MQTTLTPALRFEIKELIDERIREKHVTREDFTELKDIVKEIAREQRELTIAQKETQKEMKEAQKEIKSLALAIKDTKEELKGDIKELRRDLNYTRKDLGGVTSTLGFMLENEAYRILPKLLKDRYKIEVKERFLRRSIRSFGIEAEGEVNVFSHGLQQDTGKKVVIIGEAKSQLGKDDIDDLLDTVAKLKDIEKEQGRFLLVVTHYTKETVVEYAKEKGVEVIQSFEW
ncbi:hypothetical protein KKG61_01200 [bacterium]|nr:hypothetical protein [bacterium]MBU1598716.1 hypothetical protein [bacterium]MBU2461361.1 hypothetical protein [bacterium]